ncbi:MAG: zf-HC2 domain-containing protein [bacterium]|nr:zf-HC2 domain-containing protein [bacterium]
MKTCHNFTGLISEYVEGNISQQDRVDFENHLKHCDDCYQKMNSTRKLHHVLRQLPSLKVSSDFEAILRARIRIENKRPLYRTTQLLTSWKFRVPAYSLSAILILLAVVFIYSKISQQNSYTQQAINSIEWKGGYAAEQSATNGAITIYSIDQKPIKSIVSQNRDVFMGQPTKILEKTSSIDSTRHAARQDKRLERSQADRYYYATSY